LSNNDKGLSEKPSDKFKKIKDYGIPLGVMAISLVIIYILWASFGYIGPSFSNQVLSNQQETLREKYNLPSLENEGASESEVPPSLREVMRSNATPTSTSQNSQSKMATQSSTNTTISESSGNVTSSSTKEGPSQKITTTTATGVTLKILEGSSIQGNPDYDPDELTVKKGDTITVNNEDTMPHTVTNGESGSDPNSGKLFDTSIINGGDSAEIDTSSVDAGAYPFYCMVHPYMTGSLTIE
jgi:cytochrome c oxidase subunit 2